MDRKMGNAALAGHRAATAFLHSPRESLEVCCLWPLPSWVSFLESLKKPQASNSPKLVIVAYLGESNLASLKLQLDLHLGFLYLNI